MKKYATPTILLFALSVIVLGAFLPQLASAWLFPSNSGKVNFIAVNNVQLEFDSTGQQSQISEKLAMLVKYNDTMELPDSLATLTDDRILEILQDTVGKYQKAGLLPVGLQQLTKRDILSAQPYMVSWDLSDIQSTIFWNVSVLLTNGQYLDLILDDQTGTVCSITLTKSDETLETTVNTAQLKNQMRALCSLYLEELGTAFSRFDADSIASNAYFQGENTLISTLSWSDIMYGEVRINFLISPDQFSVRVV